MVAAVARIFGGTKLGTGGLARAYGGAVSEAIMLVEKEEKRMLICVYFKLPFAFEAQARHLLKKFDGVLESVDYTESVLMRVSLDNERLALFTTELQNASGGQCELLDL